MKRAHFRVVGRLHMASAMVEGTVTDVATMVCQRIAKAEEFQKRLQRAAKRKAR